MPAVLLATTGPVAGAAQAHIADATAGITHDLYTPAQSSRCIYGPNNCSTHSFTYISANDTANTNRVCAELYQPSDHSTSWGWCAFDYATFCKGSSHSPGGDAHCNDQDSTMYHAGAANAYLPGANQGTTIRRHGIY